MKTELDTRPELAEALRFVRDKHSGQVRKGKTPEPYVNHVIRVGEIVAKSPDSTAEDIIAALLHDAVEDMQLPDGRKPTKADHEVAYAEIRAKFGPAVEAQVRENTDDPDLPVLKQKEAQIAAMPHKSRGAKKAKMADAIDNVRSLRDDPPQWRPGSASKYAQTKARLFEAGRGTCPVIEGIWDEMWPGVRQFLTAA